MNADADEWKGMQINWRKQKTKAKLPLVMSSVHKPPFRKIRFTELTDGMVFGSHIL